MINKRKQLAERILLIINGGTLTKDKSFKIADIELAVDSQFAYLMKAGYYQNISLEERNVDGQYVTTFTNVIPVLDEARNEWYIERPAIYVNLPRCAGVIRISSIKQLDDDGTRIPPYAYVPAGTSYNSLRSYFLEGGKGWYPEGDRMYFLKTPDENLMVKLLVASITDINLTPDMEAPIMDYVLKQYMPQLPSDRTNDGIKLS